MANKFVLVAMMCIAMATSHGYFNSEVPCVHDADCHIAPAVSSQCVRNMCAYSADITRHLEQSAAVSRLGSECKFDQDCIVDQAICLQNRCACNNYTVSSLMQQNTCINSTEYGEECKEDVQCREKNTVCINEQCSCGGGYKRSQQVCVELRGLSDPCSEKRPCELPSARCSAKGLCECEEGYFAMGNECAQTNLTYLSPCKSSKECVHSLGELSVCFEHLCHCQAHARFYKSDNKCLESLTSLDEEVASTGAQFSMRMMCVELFLVVLISCILSISPKIT